MAAALPCNLQVPSQYATVGAAVTTATTGQVICVAAGNYCDSFFDLATKGLTLQGARRASMLGRAPLGLGPSVTLSLLRMKPCPVMYGGVGGLS